MRFFVSAFFCFITVTSFAFPKMEEGNWSAINSLNNDSGLISEYEIELKEDTLSLTFLVDINSEAIILVNRSEDKPNPLLQHFKKKQRLNKRVTAAILAFPFPFGIVGLHRIYLGTKAHVPVAYIASLGGVFGILPLIDFFAITFDKDFNQYKNNGKVLMWVKD